jgi:hypothetical protein
LTDYSKQSDFKVSTNQNSNPCLITPWYSPFVKSHIVSEGDQLWVTGDVVWVYYWLWMFNATLNYRSVLIGGDLEIWLLRVIRQSSSRLLTNSWWQTFFSINYIHIYFIILPTLGEMKMRVLWSPSYLNWIYIYLWIQSI